MSREEQVKAAMKGDDEAFYALIIANKEKLYRMAYSYLKNVTDALEAIQEVTCRAYVRVRKLKEPQYFNTWLMRIMINYCIDELKKKNKGRVYEVNLENSDLMKTADNIINFNRFRLEWALEHIDPKIRTVIELKYFHDLTIAEIARTLERPEGTIKTWLNRGLIGLRELFQKDGEADV